MAVLVVKIAFWWSKGKSVYFLRKGPLSKSCQYKKNGCGNYSLRLRVKMISISTHGNICEAAPQGSRLPRTIFWVLNGFSESSEMRFEFCFWTWLANWKCHYLNRPIKGRTEIVVHRSGPRTRIGACSQTEV